MMLGVLMDLAGPDTNVMICSDHGFHPDHLRVQEIPNEPAGPADEHRHFGMFAAGGPGFRRDELVFGATLLDITPTILALHGLPVGKDMDGRMRAASGCICSTASSGTSLLMQMLAAGGLPILTDGAREADADNPRGYLEYDLAKRPDAGSGWLMDARGKAVKIVAQLLPALTATHRYRVIFAERPLNEVIASQRVMLERGGKAGGRIAERALAQTYLKQIAQVRRILTPHGERAQVLSVGYHEALAEPAAIAARLNAFLGGGLDEAAMVAAVEPALRRQHG